MHKQMTANKNSRILLAAVLVLLASVLFALAGIFGFGESVFADENDPVVSEPAVTADERYNRIFAGNTQNEFALSSESWVYGTDPAVPTPKFEFDPAAGDGEPNITLHLNSEEIATNIKTHELANYINKYMPVGDYSLVLTSPNVTKDGVFYNSKTYQFEFTVERAPMPKEYMQDVAELLTTGERNEYIYDGKPKFYAADITFDIVEKGAAAYERGQNDRGQSLDVYWVDAVADKYFGGFELVMNVVGGSTDHYHTLEYYNKYYAGDNNYNFDCEPTAPCEPGKYTVSYMLIADNYLDSIDISSEEKYSYCFDVVIYGVVDVPSVPSVYYNGTPQKGAITDSLYYTVDDYAGWEDAGTYYITLRLRNPECYLWDGQSLDDKTRNDTPFRVPFTINKASNVFTVLPDVVRWIEGSYNPNENLIVGEAQFGDVEFVIADADDNVVYSSADDINELAGLTAGSYNFTATVKGTDNYTELSYSKFLRVLEIEKQGLPWWGTFAITVGALLLAALIILILYKKGVFSLLTDKIALAIRTKATTDAVIAAVRANKVAEQSKASIAEAEAHDRAEERAEARRQAAIEERNKPQAEKFAAMEAKAKATAEKAEAMRQKAEAMQAKVENLKAKAAEKAAKNNNTETTAETAEKSTEPRED